MNNFVHYRFRKSDPLNHDQSQSFYWRRHRPNHNQQMTEIGNYQIVSHTRCSSSRVCVCGDDPREPQTTKVQAKFMVIILKPSTPGIQQIEFNYLFLYIYFIWYLILEQGFLKFHSGDPNEQLQSNIITK